jgi:hypothetical protein
MSHSVSDSANAKSSAKVRSTSVSIDSVSTHREDVPFESNVAIDDSFDSLDESLSEAAATGIAECSAESEEVIQRYVGRWNRLISQTNWEKGAIISQWRAALVDSGAPSSAYSDDAWSKRVEGVSSQHVGRLRRVFDRFSKNQESYKGLYWTHFLAALDWDDAELWLEGAVQSKWSIAQMRRTRWQALGGDPKSQPGEHDLVTAESDEGYSPSLESPIAEADDSDEDEERNRATTGPLDEEPDFGDEGSGEYQRAEQTDDSAIEMNAPNTPAAMLSPFSDLPTMPVDIAECMEQFKIAIIRHRSSGWQDIMPSDVCKVLDALRGFAMAGIA